MANLKKIKKYAVIIAVIILPLVYSFFYLGAFWDPYSKMSDLPVAVVNHDEGANINGKQKNIGNDLVDKLKNDTTLKWVITDGDDAKDGLDNRRYYAQIIIPKDFSQKIATVDSNNKSKATFEYQVNEKRNFLAGQILNRVMIELKDNVASNVTKEVVNELVVQAKKVPNDLKELDDGLGKIYDGTDKLSAGLGELKDNQVKLNSGIGQINSGILEAKAGTEKLLPGSLQLSENLKLFAEKLTYGTQSISQLKAGSMQFNAGINELNNGAKQLAAGTATLKQSSDALAKGSLEYNTNFKTFSDSLSQVLDGTVASVDQGKKVGEYFTQYVNAHPEAMKDANIQAIAKMLQASSGSSDKLSQGAKSLKDASVSLADASAKLSEGTAKLAQGADTVNQSINKISGASSQLATSYGQINNGILTVEDSMKTASQGATLLADGSSQLKDGISQLNGGMNKLAAGSSELQANGSKFIDGEQKLLDGSNELKSGVKTAKDGVSSSIAKASDKLKNTDGIDGFVASPVELKEEKVNMVPDYGTAFAPYFISLSLWIGALLMFFSVYMDPEVRFRKGKHKFAKYFGYVLLGAVQSVVLCFVIQRGLNLQVKNTFVFYAVSLVISLCFIGIMQFLIVNLKNVGQFLAILLLILQLTSCGGTFPMEVVPKFFNVLNPFMPMTYSVNALKESISGIDYNYLYFNLLILGIIMLFFLALSVFLSKWKEKYAPEEDVDDETIVSKGNTLNV